MPYAQLSRVESSSNDTSRFVAIGLFCAALSLAACASTQDQIDVPESKQVCVVLSVGGEDGLAHIGVLKALKEAGIKPSCVYGNSMGSLVGGLYAANPEGDLEGAYRAVMTAYVAQTKSETESVVGVALFFSLVLGLPPFESAIVGAAAIGSVNEVDRRRLVRVLDDHFQQRTISELPVDFVTWHDHLRSTPVKVRLNSGNLAEAIGYSIANPLIFPDVQASRNEHVDPGADRVSAVPLEDACRLRPDAHFIVSNVIKQPIYYSDSMKCSYDEIRIDTPKIDPRKAFAGESPDFDRIVSSGFDSTKRAL